MPWKCPECDAVNRDDNITLCNCGYRVDSGEIEIRIAEPSPAVEENWEKVAYAFTSLLIPIFFAFSVFVGIMSGLLFIIYAAAFICFCVAVLCLRAIREKGNSARVRQLAYMGGALNSACVLFFLAGCSFTHEYGPYRGEVVDKETGQALAGAVITMRVYTTTPSAGGPVGSFVYTAETITNEDGEFSVPAHRLKKLSPLTSWDNEYILIFKPGYACYPGKDSEPYFVPSGTLPENQFVTIRLPQFKSIEEQRKKTPCLDEAGDHLYIFSRYYDQNQMALGLKPHRLRNYYYHKDMKDLTQKTILDYPKPVKKITAEYSSWNPPAVQNNRGVVLKQPVNNTHGNYGGRQIVIPPSRPADKVYLVKYQSDEIQAELIDKLQQEKIDFRLADGNVVISEKDKTAIDGIMEGIDNKSHMLFLDREKKDMFVNLLQLNNIPFTLRTQPDVVGYDVIWDYADNDKAELLKLRFYQNIIRESDQFASTWVAVSPASF